MIVKIVGPWPDLVYTLKNEINLSKLFIMRRGRWHDWSLFAAWLWLLFIQSLCRIILLFSELGWHWVIFCYVTCFCKMIGYLIQYYVLDQWIILFHFLSFVSPALTALSIDSEKKVSNQLSVKLIVFLSKHYASML